MIGHIEQMLREIPEVESYSRRTGLAARAGGGHRSQSGDIAVKLKTKRSRSVDEVIAELRAKIKQQEPASTSSSSRCCRT